MKRTKLYRDPYQNYVIHSPGTRREQARIFLTELAWTVAILFKYTVYAGLFLALIFAFTIACGYFFSIGARW